MSALVRSGACKGPSALREATAKRMSSISPMETVRVNRTHSPHSSHGRELMVTVTIEERLLSFLKAPPPRLHLAALKWRRYASVCGMTSSQNRLLGVPT
jgi:hypothetical protein